MQQPSVQLFAPPEYWSLTPAQRADMCNGCGSKGWCGYVVPDSLLGLCVTPACDIHDYMYTVGATIGEKVVADRIFLNNMLRLIDAGGGWGFIKRWRADLAHDYFDTVSKFGGPAFWDGKNKPEEMGAA